MRRVSAGGTEADRYNGWTNYETWCVNLWLGNDEPTHRTVSALVVAATAEAVRSNPPRAAAHVVADRLGEWVTNELAPDLGATFAADLLSHALGRVDWHEIARELLDP